MHENKTDQKGQKRAKILTGRDPAYFLYNLPKTVQNRSKTDKKAKKGHKIDPKFS